MSQRPNPEGDSLFTSLMVGLAWLALLAFAVWLIGWSFNLWWALGWD